MNLLDLAYIALPPALALGVAGVIVWRGNTETEKLDAEIAAYRARKAEEREAATAATTAAKPPPAGRLDMAMAAVEDRMWGLQLDDGTLLSPDMPATARMVAELKAHRRHSTTPSVIMSAAARAQVLYGSRKRNAAGKPFRTANQAREVELGVRAHDPARGFVPQP